MLTIKTLIENGVKHKQTFKKITFKTCPIVHIRNQTIKPGAKAQYVAHRSRVINITYVSLAAGYWTTKV